MKPTRGRPSNRSQYKAARWKRNVHGQEKVQSLSKESEDVHLGSISDQKNDGDSEMPNRADYSSNIATSAIILDRGADSVVDEQNGSVPYLSNPDSPMRMNHGPNTGLSLPPLDSTENEDSSSEVQDISLQPRNDDLFVEATAGDSNSASTITPITHHSNRDAFFRDLDESAHGEYTREFWDFIQDEKRFEGYDMSNSNEWRPFQSEFDWHVLSLWMQGNFGRDQWQCIVKFMKEVESLRRRGERCSTIPSSWTMERRADLLCVIPKPHCHKVQCLSGKTFSQYTDRDWQSHLQFLRNGRADFDEKSDLRLEEQEFYYSPLTWTVYLQSLLPNNDRYLALTPTEFEYDDPHIRGILDTPMIRDWNTWNNGQFLSVRAGQNPLILRCGHVYISSDHNTWWMILKMRWHSPSKWSSIKDDLISSRVRGAQLERSQTLQQFTVDNTRFLVEVFYTEIHNFGMHSNSAIVQNPDLLSNDHIKIGNISRVLYGENAKRTPEKDVVIENNDYFKDWLQPPKKLNVDVSQVSEMVNHETLQIEELSREVRESLTRVVRTPEGPPSRWDDLDVVPIALSLGFDEFSCSGFSNNNQKLFGYYWKIHNYREVPLPWHSLSVTRSGIPEKYVLRYMWQELCHLRKGLPLIAPFFQEDGSLIWRTKLIQAELTSVACDKQSLDDFQSNIRSGARDTTRVEGCFYHGGKDDPLAKNKWFNLNGLFLKNCDWWMSEQRNLIRRGPSLDSFKRVTSMEGYSRHFMSVDMIPQREQYVWNNILCGVVDLYHTWITLLSHIVKDVKRSLKDKDKNVLLKVYDQLLILNNWPRLSDPFGDATTNKTKFRLKHLQYFNFVLCLNHVQRHIKEVKVLKLGLLLFGWSLHCETENDVKLIQKMTLAFMRECRKKQSLDINKPKFRALLSIAFVNLPLYRGTVAMHTLNTERNHLIPKRWLLNHNNNHDRSMITSTNRPRRLLSMDYLRSGGFFGRKLRMKLGVQAQGILNKWTGDSRIHKLGVSDELHLNVGISRARRVTRKKIKEWMTGLINIPSMEKTLIVCEVMREGENLSQLFDSNRWDFWDGIQCHICDRDSRFEWKTKDGKRYLSALDANGDPFLIECVRAVLFSRTGRTEYKMDDRHRCLFFGKCYRLRRDDPTNQTKTILKNEGLHGQKWWFSRDEKGEGEDFLGTHWVSGCSIWNPVAVIHRCLAVPQDCDKCGPTIVNTLKKWVCNVKDCQLFDVFDPDFLYVPRLWHSYPFRRCVSNKHFECTLAQKESTNEETSMHDT